MTSGNTLDRRRFLLATVVSALPAKAASGRLDTLTDWMRADRKDRDAGVRSCLERIKMLDPSIQAWVQVLPQQPTGEGRLSGIPFGAKDVIETQGSRQNTVHQSTKAVSVRPTLQLFGSCAVM